MKRLINFIKRDYEGVKWSLQNQFKYRVPTWAVLLYYCVFMALLWPVVLLVWIGFRIWFNYQIKELEKMERG